MKTAFFKFLLWTSCAVICVATFSLETARFERASYCSGRALKATYAYHSKTSRSSIECTLLCRMDSRCKSVVFHQGERLCHLSEDVARQDCSNMVAGPPGVKHYQRAAYCNNGGTVAQHGKCLCPAPFCGPLCDQLMEDCQDVADCGGFTKKAVYLIKPALSPEPFPVFCVLRLRRTYVLRRLTAATDFNRTWAEYRDGFGKPEHDHWLGLRRLRELTNSRTYTLRFILKARNGSQAIASYDNFVLGDEAVDFSFTCVPQYNTLLEDCLTPLLGAGFSTRDQDNDGDADVDCAKLHGAGWWFKGKNCSQICNPLGPMLKPASGRRLGVPDEAFWQLSKHADDPGSDLVPFIVTVYLIH